MQYISFYKHIVMVLFIGMLYSTQKEINFYADSWALLIGINDYQNEPHLNYAVADAERMRRLLNEKLDFPADNIFMLLDEEATLLNIKKEMKKLSEVANENDRVLIYFAGHGITELLPTEGEEGYLMPVDISGTNVQSGIKLKQVFKDLNAYPSKEISVFLDACFSGGARNEGLIAMKGVKIKPKEETISGNMVVFASSSGNESSAVYRDKKHGYFTYFLLKKLQETKGNVSYKEMSDYLNYQVSKKTALSGKIQTPQLNVSSSVGSSWESWSFR